MAPAVTTEEAFRLARAMTLRMPRGLAARCRQIGDLRQPKMPLRNKELIRAFAKAIADLTDYIRIG
jgi:hypothetical protein